ncbi:glycosyltransferase [Vibrio aestuarianus]|uniref:glycosyltransferase n=1 Tax=Vibrio aestuarianus TaxID=28171 RepID=UPI00237D27A7|nr:glycosyltransferase [Vibrio aestuarianus]MDE1211678.1 glycosyltransferase [Vibrio aestuarianus]MDE1251614.1 glycosyltransferase [Vibrio aestuarianus]
MFDKTEQEIMRNWKGSASQPLVSISTAAFNHEKYIGEAIDSFLMQETDFPFEVVIGEDCSDDSTLNIVEKYKSTYPNIIKIITSKENVGGQKNGRRIIDNCQGVYVAFCDGDDYWVDKNKLQIQVNELIKHPKVDICFHPAFELKNNKINKALSKHVGNNKIFTTSEVILGNGGFMPTASLLIKRNVLTNLPLWYDDAPVGDYFFQIFGSLNGGALYINKTMCVYRKNSDGSWSQKMKKSSNLLIWLQGINNSLEHLNRELNYNYSSEISTMKGRNFLVVAINELRLNNFDSFRTNISASYKLSPTLAVKFLYYFRHSTVILKGINLIKRLK